jgi:hypothetical protein
LLLLERTYDEYPDSGNTFVILEVKVKQTGSGSEYVSGSDFWLIDSNGNKYDYDSGTYSIDGGLETTDIYQNQQVSGKILFEIPDHLNNFKIQYNFGTSYSPVLIEWNLNL